MLEFLCQHKTCTADCITSAAATQAANREMLCRLENINKPIRGHMHTHIHKHAQVIVLCTCANVLISVCVYWPCQKLVPNTSSSAAMFSNLITFFCTSFRETEVKDYI